MITRYAVIVIALTAAAYACVHSPTHTVDATPARLSPVQGAIVIELDVPDWREICIRMPTPMMAYYECFSIGDVRAQLHSRRRADWKPFQAESTN